MKTSEMNTWFWWALVDSAIEFSTITHSDYLDYIGMMVAGGEL